MRLSKSLVSRFENFKDKYSSLYSPEAWEYIEEHFYDDIHNNDVSDILMQVFGELGIVPMVLLLYLIQN